MVAVRFLIGGLTAACIAAGVAVAPAIGATENRATTAKRAPAPLRLGGGFTPAAADPRLAALLARGGVDRAEFRFTPAETGDAGRKVTVAVRSRSVRAAQDVGRSAVAATAPTVGLAPIAYNLGVAVGWRRFAVSGDVTRVDLAGQPGSREAADLTVSYQAGRFTGRVRGAADRALPGAPKLVERGPSMALDLGGSYALTRNVDLTAGVRYKSERDRLVRLDDDRRDSQAVYLGTAFRF